MKKLLLLLFLSMGMLQVQGQVVNDNITLNPGYTHQSYYSLANGEVANVMTTDWDVAFDVSGFGSTIRINGSKGTNLYVYGNGDSSAWTSPIDTMGLGTWRQLYDSDTSWALGAFNTSADPNNAFDLGWGIYNFATHHVNGDSIFLIQLSTGAWKKMHIIRLASGTYDFRYADLDGSNEVNTSLAKVDYPDRNFVYYSLQTNTAINREPMNTDWDIVFTGYITELFPGTNYGVTGVLQNAGVMAAEAGNLADPHTYVDYTSHTFHHEINTIGFDWKSFGGAGFSLDDSLAYFISDVNGQIWRIVFTGFDGSSTGNVAFEKELIVTVNIDDEEAALQSFAMYPNPATDQKVTFVYDLLANEAELSIFNLNGVKVRSELFSGSGFQERTVSLDGLSAGMYLVSLKSGETEVRKRLMVR